MGPSRKSTAPDGAPIPEAASAAEKAEVAIAAVHTVPDDRKGDVATAAVSAAAEATSVDIATAAVNAAPEADKADIAAAAVRAASVETKADVAAAAIDAVPDTKKADAITSVIKNAPQQVGDQVANELLPDQRMTNQIWLWIVKTFAFVLGGATVALVGAIFCQLLAQGRYDQHPNPLDGLYDHGRDSCGIHLGKGQHDQGSVLMPTGDVIAPACAPPRKE